MLPSSLTTTPALAYSYWEVRGFFWASNRSLRDQTNGLTSLSTDGLAKEGRSIFNSLPGRELNLGPPGWQSGILLTALASCVIYRAHYISIIHFIHDLSYNPSVLSFNLLPFIHTSVELGVKLFCCCLFSVTNWSYYQQLEQLLVCSCSMVIQRCLVSWVSTCNFAELTFTPKGGKGTEL